MKKEINAKMWGIHSGDDMLFLNHSPIAIGWEEMGNLGAIPVSRETSRETYKKRFLEVYPHAKQGAVGTTAGMFYRFVYEMQIGDYIVFPSKIDRKINLGIIEGNYYYDENATHYRNRRKVKWVKHIPRTAFSHGALNEVGSALTVFRVKNYASEFLKAFDVGFTPEVVAPENDETVMRTTEDIIESTKDFILKELSKNLKGYDLEDFVANLLQAMGYRTTSSPHGGDGGVDIVAYKDELPPRIVVQVKSQDSDIPGAVIQSLKGAMKEGDYGLFVTLSNYTKNARQYLDSTPIIRGINGTELVDLILKYYNQLDEKYRRMIPLKMVYIPMITEEV